MGGGNTKQAGAAAGSGGAGGAGAKKKKGKDPRAQLSDRIAAGREKEVMEMLNKSPELLNEALDDGGMRPLQVACREGHIDVVKGLLSLGAFLDAKNEAGATALMYAAAGGFDKICKLVLDAGADVRITDNEKQNALQYAQLNNRTNVEKLLQIYACEYTW